MLMTQRRRLRVAAGTMETANLLFLKLLVQNRSAARVYPGLVFREYMSLTRHGKWSSESIFEFLPELETSRPRIVLEHVPGEGINTAVEELAFMALITKALQPNRIFEIGTLRGRTALNFALNSPDDCVIYTLDLPPEGYKDGMDIADTKLTQMRAPGIDLGAAP